MSFEHAKPNSFLIVGTSDHKMYPNFVSPPLFKKSFKSFKKSFKICKNKINIIKGTHSISQCIWAWKWHQMMDEAFIHTLSLTATSHRAKHGNAKDVIGQPLLHSILCPTTKLSIAEES